MRKNIFGMIRIKQAVPRMPEYRFQSPVDWDLSTGKHWAVIGPNGAGKTILTDILTEKIPLKEGHIVFSGNMEISDIKSMAFRDIYDLADCKNAYYQQRWNSSDTENLPFVGDLLSNPDEEKYLQDILQLFKLEDLLSKRLINLSSGELRKFLIIRSLLKKPKILILDNPYIGLDSISRQSLNTFLSNMTTITQLQLILVLADPNDIPDMISHIQPVLGMRLKTPFLWKSIRENQSILEQLFPGNLTKTQIPVQEYTTTAYQHAIKMEHIHIAYGEKTILNNLSWTVRRGEKWALLGSNGSGKSTLLSLVCADNPQSYANTFYLFDRKRGTGESIWDIKKRIGYISPEMHLYYLQDVPVADIVGSGFFDSIGLYRKCSEKQREQAIEWMEIFGIDRLKDRSFLKISHGEQRMALLARAFVKHPELLILDEPLHGLDKTNKTNAKMIIDQYCSLPDKTLIYVTHYPEEIPSCVSHHLTLSDNL